MNICLYAGEKRGISDAEISDALIKALDGKKPRKALIIPPDITRANSYCGEITRMLYSLLSKSGCETDILPALGTHMPLTDAELDFMYSGIPHEAFKIHNWKSGCVKLGEIPPDVMAEISGGFCNEAVSVEVNKLIMDKSYELIISAGQVVPHEISGMSNYNKNIFVGCGGSGMINASHYIGALYGMERIMGRDHTPLHKMFDYAREHFLKDVPLLFVLTVTTLDNNGTRVECLSIGEERDTFEKAVAVSREKNIIYLDKPIKKAVVYLDPAEFKSTWLCNKAVYRTKMCMADGGELVILAPGLVTCGEDPVNDRLLKKYGYVGKDEIIRLAEENADLRENLSVAAHIIHSSSNGRFRITYAPKNMTEQEIRSINYDYLPYEKAAEMYPVEKLSPGWNILNGEEIYYIANPAIGLWMPK